MPSRPSRRLVLVALAGSLLVSPAGAQSEAVAALAAIIEQRLLLMGDVARSKWTTGAPIDDPEREAALLAAGAGAAAASGLDPAAATTLLRGQIEAAKLVQRRWFARWRAAGQGPFAGGAALLAARRPEIARLSTELVPAYARAAPELAACAGRTPLETVPSGLVDDAAAWAEAVRGILATLPACS